MPRTVRVFTALALGTAAFIGLPILGWGPTDLGGFLAHPARLLYLVAVLVLNMIVAIQQPEVGRKHKPETKGGSRQRWAVPLFQIISVALVMVAPYCDRRELAVVPGGDPVRYLGLALYVAGMLLMHRAQVALGRQFSTQVVIQNGHQLITSGPYRTVRHPRYLGMILLLSGLALVFRSSLAAALLGAMGLVLAWRIRDEEALLRATFGAEWEAYARKSRRLIPFLY